MLMTALANFSVSMTRVSVHLSGMRKADAPRSSLVA